MSLIRRVIEAPSVAVFDVLSDPRGYACLASAEVLGKVLGVRPRSRMEKGALDAVGHMGLGASFGLMRGALDRLGVGAPAAGTAVFAAAMLPELVALPALGASEPPWDWTAADAAATAFHHGVFAATVAIVYEQMGT